MKSTEITQAADRLWQAALTKTVCEPIRQLIDAQDLESAYAVQSLITARRVERGARQIGCKIGLTSFAVQKQLGVDQPDYGILFDDMQITDTISMDDLMQPKAEAEIAFVMNADLVGEITESTVAAAIDYACAAIEIVGSRIANWDIKIADTIADNASASHFILGNKHVALGDIDLVNCKMNMSCNGEVVSEGKGEACMGSPLVAATWLAQTMHALGNPLKKGDIVLSGALGPMHAVHKNDHFIAEIEGLGSVEFKTI